MSSAIRRLQKDYLEYESNRDDFTLISACPLEDNLFECHVNICAPSGPYANLPLHLILEFPENYPETPPKVCLCTRIDHPNVFGNWGSNGAWICLDMLKAYTVTTKYEGWSSVYTLTSILLQLQSFLFSENVPQDYGGDSSLKYGNQSVVSSLQRIRSFHCKKCGHCTNEPAPALPKAYYDLLKRTVSHTGAKIWAQDGAIINQNTVFWQDFPEWKTATWDCGDLLKKRGSKLQYEVKIDWGWDGYYREDIRIGWGYITSHKPLEYKVICESPADVGEWYWPEGMKVGDILTTAIDLDKKLVWYAVNGKILPVKKFPHCNTNGKPLVPIFRFRACRLLFNFGIPMKPVTRFNCGAFKILEPPQLKPAAGAARPEIEEWKSNYDACAEVFPVTVIQDILGFLPMPDVINARSSCPSLRSMIEEAAIIPRREVHCFKTKKTHGETVLGIGLSCEKSMRLKLKEVKPNMEFLSLEEWESGHRMSAWGEELTDFLVLPISRRHFDIKLIVKYMEKFGAEYNLGNSTRATDILNIFSTLMNMCVVTMMKETQDGGKCNEKLLTGYTQFHHLLLALNEVYPEVAELAQKRVNAFIRSDSARHKNETPDLGKLLVMASICPDLDWSKFTYAVFTECSRRRVLWYLKDCASLSNVDQEDEAYCQKVFDTTEISRCIVAFQLAFLKTLALPKEDEELKDVLGKYYMRYGQPRSCDIDSLFKQAKAIVHCKTWAEHFKQTGIDMSGSSLVRILKAAVASSLKAGYHSKMRFHGKGKVQGLRGNPACLGLFRPAPTKIDDFKFRARFWLPKKYTKEIYDLREKFRGLKLIVPKNLKAPFEIGSSDVALLKKFQSTLQSKFQYVGLQQMKTSHFELSYHEISAHKETAKRAARHFCVNFKLPVEFGFPICPVTGSIAGVEAFRRELSAFIGREVKSKRAGFDTLCECKRCEMTYSSIHGAYPPVVRQTHKLTDRSKFQFNLVNFTATPAQSRSLYTSEKQADPALNIVSVNGIAFKQDPGRVRSILENEMKCTVVLESQADFVCRFCWPQIKSSLRKAKNEEQARANREERRLKAEQKQRKVQEMLERAAKRDAEVAKKADAKLEQAKSTQFPASFNLLRRAQVRVGKSLKSEKLVALECGRNVEVVEVADNRARIQFPVDGWVTVVTKKGLLIDLSCVEVKHFPALGCQEKFVSDVAKSSVWKPKQKKVPRESPKQATKKSPSFSRGSSVASSSESGSSKSAPIQVIAPPPDFYRKKKVEDPNQRGVFSGRTYQLTRRTVVRENIDKKSRFVTDLKAGAEVFIGTVCRNTHRARILSPIRGWVSTWTAKGRLLK